MPMKRFSIPLLILSLWACQQAEDTRYFAPELNFEAADYSVQAAQGCADKLVKAGIRGIWNFTAV